MSNGFYQYGMLHFARGDVAWKASGGSNVVTALIDSANYTVDLANHETRSSVPDAARGATSGNMTLVDAMADGVVDANDITFTNTTGPTTCEGILVYKNGGGGASTDLLLFWWDTASGLPVTLGGDVTIAWDSGANRIAKI